MYVRLSYEKENWGVNSCSSSDFIRKLDDFSKSNLLFQYIFTYVEFSPLRDMAL